MGKFKKGDRVKYCGGYKPYNVTEHIGHLGTVEDDGAAMATTVRWDAESGHPAGVVFRDNIELVEQPWQPKVGDRVRMVKDGRSTTGAVGKAATIRAWSDGSYIENGEYLLDIDPPVDYQTLAVTPNYTRATIDCFEPLPVAAKAQSAALTIQAGKYYRTRDGRKVGPLRTWPDLDGNPYPDRLCEVHGDGRYWLLDGSGSGDSDIIAEWADEPAVASDTVAVAAIASNDNEPVAERPAYKVGDKVRSLVDWCDTTVGDILPITTVSENGVWATDRLGDETYLAFDEIEPAPQQSTAGFTIPLVEDEPAVAKDGSTQLTVRITSDFTELHEQIDYAFERLKKLKKKARKLGIELDFAKAA
ncbi:hypothetical protein GOD90_10765 [Sinorhizobium medicae]|nr:hypothetical protein [Sinorhizobium medicae]